MFQGGGESDRKNARRMPVPPASIDFVLSTHAHIDHSGLLPKLVRTVSRPHPLHLRHRGPPRVMLPDAGHIQEREAEWQTRKRSGEGSGRSPRSTRRPTRWPSSPRCAPFPTGIVHPGPGVSAAFLDAGAHPRLGDRHRDRRGRGEGKEAVFSGDLATGGCRSSRSRPRPAADALSSNRRTATGSTRGWKETVEEFVHAVDDTLRRKNGERRHPVVRRGTGAGHPVPPHRPDAKRAPVGDHVVHRFPAGRGGHADHHAPPRLLRRRDAELFAWRDAHPTRRRSSW